MMRTTRTHYEVLGLPRGATRAQIRRRYKELVRKFHPDVAADKDTAHRLFIQINEAYDCLTDPVRKRAYDDILDMDAPKPRTEPSRAARPEEKGMSQLLKDAQWAFIQRRFNEAASHCKEALRRDLRNARAYAILGDAYRAQGKVSSAIRAYTNALQYDPNDSETHRKLTRLVCQKLRADRAPRRMEPITGAPRIGATNAVGWALAFFLIMLINVFPGQPIPWLAHYIPQVAKWSWNLVCLMAAASFVIGALLSINGLLKHPDDEIVFQSSGSDWALIPAGLILLIGSGFFFLGAALFYIAVGLIQASLSRSVLIDFACVVGVVALSALMCDPAARSQVLLFGGNVAFLASLFGWYVGAIARPLGDG